MRYSDFLRAGRFGVRNPVWARFSTPIQTGTGATQAPVQWLLGLFRGIKATDLWHRVVL